MNDPSATRRAPADAPASPADAVLSAMALVATAIAYAPIVNCYFFSDDFLNLYQIANFGLGRYLLTPNGGHLLLSRNLVFYFSHALFGNEPTYYYACALLLHLVNVALLFHLLRRLTGRRELACFGAILWGTSPTSEGTLAWYAVFGQVMGVTTTLIILSRAASLAARDQWPARREIAVWYLLALIGATAFGTGLALAAILPLALWWLLPRHAPGARRRPPLVSLPVVVPLLYGALMVAYATVSGQTAAEQTLRAAMLSDVGAIALTLARLSALGLTRLLLGFWHVALPDPSWQLVMSLSALAVGGAAFFSSPRQRRTLAAALVLALASYGAIALARGALLLSFAEDVIPRVTRYHYAGQIFLTMALCAALAPLFGRAARWTRSAALAAWLAATITAYLLLAPAIDLHDEARAQTHAALREIHTAIRAQPAGADVILRNAFFRPLPLPGEFFPARAAVFVIFFPANTVDGRRVFFLERRPATLKAAATGRRTATLFVSSPAPSLPPAAPRR